MLGLSADLSGFRAEGSGFRAEGFREYKVSR